MTVRERVFGMFRDSVPPDRVSDVVEWAREWVNLPGSARTSRFDPTITPWTQAPIRCIDDGTTRRMVFVKPIQSGGSVVGEVAMCYWVATKNGGDIQFNWQTGEKADNRYDRRIERILKACGPVMRRWPQDKNKARRGQVIFPHCNLIVQGIFSEANVQSDSIKFQINEEVHDEDGWLPGRLEQAFGRTTAVWDAVVLVISNAGRKGSELEKAFQSGSQEHWEVVCPSCGERHTMRTRWEKEHPELGGLRYDSEGCKRGDEYDYNKLAATIRYQFPCGYEMPDDIKLRRQLSLSGAYSAPRNPGAPPSHRSFTLEAVAVDYIPWLRLVMEKHSALKSLKYGDPEPWHKYLRERECIFADESDRPLVGKVLLSSVHRKRQGLEGRAARFAAGDRQQGSLSKGELPHWWLVIRDFMPNGDSLLVWEGKCHDDSELDGVLAEHGVNPPQVVLDSGYDSMHVYQLCLKRGYSCIKGDEKPFFAHTDKSRRIYSEERPLHAMVGAPPMSPLNPLQEPQFWFYSKPGIRDRLHWLRGAGAVKWEVPSDVSSDYVSHMEAEEMEERKNKFGQTVVAWIQRRPRNDLFVCECYLAMLAEMAGLIGARAVGESTVEPSKTND